MTAIGALIGYAAWTLGLVTCVFLWRGLHVLKGVPVNAWPRGARRPGDSALALRMEDAHANCLENLPVFAVIVLVAAALGRLVAIDALAPYVLYLRIAQTAVHLSGTGVPQVTLRAGLWAAQVVLCFLMMARLLSA